MRLKEQRLWDTMKRHAPVDVYLERVENLVDDGTPDVLVGGARWTWVELKAPTRPKRESTPLLGNKEGLRKSQINWHRKAQSMGLESYILIRDVDQHELFLLPNAFAPSLNGLPATELRDFSLASDWNSVFEVLSS